MATKVNADLVRERENATFDVNTLSAFIFGGKENLARKRYVESLVINDPDYKNAPNYHFLDRSEVYSEGIRKAFLMVKKVKELGLHKPEELVWFSNTVFPNESNPISLHVGMFLQTLLGQANEEQQAQWLKKALNFEIIGTYVQTEMGHGTFVRGLETTATYDVTAEEFVLHSPTLTSMKWWPGGLGKTSNFAVVMADLRIKGRSHGMGAFLVQLRDFNTHQPCKGITLGDIGPKAGFNMTDNGFLRMDSVRIPRTNMLMKNSKVLKNGTFVKSKHAKLSYGVMLFIRSFMVSAAGKSLSQAAIIATRYSCVRHQSELKPGAPEPQVLDFQTQQHKVFPQLATAYAYTFAGGYMAKMYMSTNNEVQQGVVDNLAQLHALSSCLKAVVTFGTAFGVEICRMACGGHGFSQASGIPKIYDFASPACTYEGENTVLLLQTARYLVKMCAAAHTGQTLPETVAYLGETSTRSNLDKSLNLGELVAAFKHRVRRLVQRASNELSRLSASGLEPHDAWNACSVNLSKAAKAHGELFIVKNFVDRLRLAPLGGVSIALKNLCQLYATNLLIQNSGEFLEDGYITQLQINQIADGELALLAAIRPNAIALTDAFDFSDHHLQSVLGRYDGNVYDNLYKWAAESPLNKQQVHSSFEKYMKPFRKTSKL